MPMDAPLPGVTRPARILPAILSAVIPGLGQAVKGQSKQASWIFFTGLLLLAVAWGLGRIGGWGAAIFFLMLVGLPWWVIQAYDAYLSFAQGSSGLRTTLQTAWQRAHDIRFLGALFLLTAFMDLYIILANPTYSLTIFCTKPAGMLGVLAKAQSPTLHVLIGYGFLRLRRWSLFVYMIYAAFGLVNATVNFACLGYGRVRTVFLLTLIAFTAYVFWRRTCFRPDGQPSL
ncbi:MAG: hypothetical protein ACREJU_17870 [Nitrospiraceae bacterium]